MFGYVMPLKSELKVKHFELFRSYYCGLCLSIKNNYGNIPRLAINYDMTFLAVLLDGLKDDNPIALKKGSCIAHPLRKRSFVIDNSPLDYAAFCNIVLFYFKLLDDVEDDKSFKSKFLSMPFSIYIRKVPKSYENMKIYIKESLKKLSKLEHKPDNITLDEFSHPFADLTGYIISNYYSNLPFYDNLYLLGYNLGKWIYLIDAWDDLNNDMKENKFNPINSALNKENLDYESFIKQFNNRIEFTLVSCASNSFQYLNKLPLKKNNELLANILELGLMHKIDKLFQRSNLNYEKSI